MTANCLCADLDEPLEQNKDVRPKIQKNYINLVDNKVTNLLQQENILFEEVIHGRN